MGVDSKLVNVDASEALLWWPAAARDYHSKSKAREAGGEGQLGTYHSYNTPDSV